MIETIKRKKSILTQEDTLELLHAIKDFPVFIGVTDQEYSKDLFADMNWYICKKTGMIQLTDLLPPDLVYSQYHSEALGQLWEEHHFEFIDFISKYVEDNILEIGGSNGFIAKNFIEKNPEKNWTIVEPNPSFNGDEKIKVMKGLFDKRFMDRSIQTIVHSHVLEHIYAPRDFLQDVFSFLNEGQYQVFSIPNLKKYLESKFTNTINFEHTFFLTEEFCDYLMPLHGFEIIEKKYFQKHSIFYAVRKNSRLKTYSLINYYDEYKSLYLSFIEYYKEEVRRINNLIDNFDGKIFLFGAHIFSQFLIYMGLKEERIVNILDNSKIKKEKRLYGTKLKVLSPSKELLNANDVAIILKAGQYQQEVRRQLEELNSSIVIWE